ncbi:MAG: hypothetical protein HZA12_03820 [Nitrospirae bacterium]|nr:hypothetical protein [Nitrospirota bacterium]
MRPIQTVVTQVIWMLIIFIYCEADAADKKEWVKLTDCLYVAQKYNDGDSFGVKCGTDEYISRLYFVDAPETNFAMRSAHVNRASTLE